MQGRLATPISSEQCHLGSFTFNSKAQTLAQKLLVLTKTYLTRQGALQSSWNHGQLNTGLKRQMLSRKDHYDEERQADH
jgi:hypothetical protein